MGKELKLRVKEAYRRDVGHGYVRLCSRARELLGVDVGDFVEIEGSKGKKTVAKVMPAYRMDEGLSIIRMDGYMRESIGVSVDDYVIVRKADPKPARRVTLAPLRVKLEIDADFTDFIKSRLIDRAVTPGTIITVPGVFYQALEFVVVDSRPEGPVKITENTILKVIPEPSAVREKRITYEDIGGLKEEIRKIREMVELPLRHPELFKRLGIDPPKGVLLYGPPGCGKTLLAKAVANESDANFFAINGPEIMSKFYGESERRLREIFQQAKEKAPSIIFIDEIDAIAPKRSEVTGEVEKRVVAQLLTLLDGLEARGDVIVIAATNMPEVLDPALRRPGRFDREIEIKMPDKEGRKEILQIHTRGMPLADDVDLDKLAEITYGYTGADLAALCREAAMKALRRYLPEIDLEAEKIPTSVLEKMVVTMKDFMDAYHDITPTAMREVMVEVPTVRWDDIGGLEKVKQELREAVEWPLTRPEVFKRIGIKPPKGILLYGPPGCGKTLLAKAVATESNANFVAIKGPEVFSKWVGESERAIREVFRRARTAAPAVIFFDEFEAIASVRGAGYADTGVTERVISQLLTEMDGIARLEDVVVLAATNRPDLIDPAILRPGRIDRLIYVPPPDLEARKQIFQIYTKKMPLAKDVDLEELAAKTEGYSGADIASVCREAGMFALRRDLNAKEVTRQDFEKALEKVPPSITPEMIQFYEGIAKRVKGRIERVTAPRGPII